jgi:hypothetical protein
MKKKFETKPLKIDYRKTIGAGVGPGGGGD